MKNWINAKNHSPEVPDRYLVCLRRYAPEELGGNSRRYAILSWTNGGWRLPVHIPKWINDEITEEVTHWQPLPDMPNDEEDEQD